MSATNHDNIIVTNKQQQPHLPQLMQPQQKQKSRKQTFLSLKIDEDNEKKVVEEAAVKDNLQQYNREHCVESKSDLPLTIQTSESIDAYDFNNCDNNNKSYKITIASSDEEGEHLPGPRGPYLKNTIPSENLARQLAQVVKVPQLTHEEKVLSWRCESVVSPVEDVVNFESYFERHEANIEQRGYFPEDTRSNSSTISSHLSGFSHRSSARLAKRQQQKHKNNKRDSNTLDINNFTEFSMRMQKEFRHQPTLNQLTNLSARLAERCNYDKPTTSAAACLAAEKRSLVAQLAVDKEKMLPPRKRKQRLDSSAESEEQISRDANNGYRPLPKRKVNNVRQQTTAFGVHNSKIALTSQLQGMITGNNKNDKKLVQPPNNDNNTPKAIEIPNNHNSNNNNNNTKEKPNQQQQNLNKTTDNTISKVVNPLILLRQDFSAKNLQLSEKRAQLFNNETQTDVNKLPPNILLPPMPESKAVDKKELKNIITKTSGDKIARTPDAAAAASHRKHVFYNLLGLTNLSTVKACHVASAELANSPTQRRSMRVRHKEQQKLQSQVTATKTSSSLSKTSPTKKSTRAIISPTKSISITNNDKNSKKPALTKKQQKMADDRSRISLPESPAIPPRNKISNLHTKVHCNNSSSSNKNNTNNNANDDKNITEKNENDDSKKNNSSSINENKPAIRIMYRFSSISQEREPPPESNIFKPPKLKTMQELRAMSKVPNFMPATSLFSKSNNGLSTPTSMRVQKKVEEIPEIIENASPQKVKAPVEICTPAACSSNVQSAARESETKQHLTTIETTARTPMVAKGLKSNVVASAPTATTITTTLKTKTLLLNAAKAVQDFIEPESQNSLRKKENLMAETVENNQAVVIDVEMEESPVSDAVIDESAGAVEVEVLEIETETTRLAVVGKPVKNIMNITSPRGGDCQYIETIELTEDDEKQNNNDMIDNNMKLDIIIEGSATHSTIMNDFENQAKIQENIEKTHSQEVKEIPIENNENATTEMIEIKLINNNNIMQDKNTYEEHVAIEPSVSNNVALEYVEISNKENKPVEKIHTVVHNIEEISNDTNTVTNLIMIDDNNEVNANQQLHDVKCHHKADTTYHISYFNKSAVTPQRNPLKSEHGRVLHIFFELDVLIVVQELNISFWKYSKLMNVLKTATVYSTNITTCYTDETEWLLLGQSQRLKNDIEISVAYSNRLCINNSIPVYLEMRGSFRTPEYGRTCPLLSLYVNVYYYHDEEMHCKIHSVNLDTVQCPSEDVTFTTIPDSRYFVMCWSQMGPTKKRKTGMVKYSLTPQLDTLASIREFKDMRHTIKLLECANDDKLLGFGETQLTIWDHRSGDVLMNYDFQMKLGRNVGSIYYPSTEMGENNMMVLFQYVSTPTMDPMTAIMATKHELLLLICGVSHVAPTYRLLKRFELPQPAFSGGLLTAENNGEHLVMIANHSDVELWINCADPNTMLVLPAQNSQRFYVRGRSQIIELTEQTLTIDNIANHLLKLNAVDNAVNGLPT